MEENIVYKVVVKGQRLGSNAGCYLKNHPTKRKGINKLKNLFNEWEGLEKFFPIYKKGAVIEKVKYSPGVFCFISKQDAERWRYNCFSGSTMWNEMESIKVKGIGKPNFVPFIKAGCANPLKLVLKKVRKRRNAISGVVTFPKIEVLE